MLNRHVALLTYVLAPFLLSSMHMPVNLLLNDNILSGTIRDGFDEFLSLDFADFSSNQLTGTIPSSFFGIRDLRFLYLSSNSLEGLIPSTWSNAVLLRDLYLDNNMLTGQVPEIPAVRSVTWLNAVDARILHSSLTLLLPLGFLHPFDRTAGERQQFLRYVEWIRYYILMIQYEKLNLLILMSRFQEPCQILFASYEQVQFWKIYGRTAPTTLRQSSAPCRPVVPFAFNPAGVFRNTRIVRYPGGLDFRPT
jgi:Leucine rich repeat